MAPHIYFEPHCNSLTFFPLIDTEQRYALDIYSHPRYYYDTVESKEAAIQTMISWLETGE